MSEWSRSATRLLALLAEERKLLTAGRASDLAALERRRSAVLCMLENARPDNQDTATGLLARIRAEARRNGDLATAYLSGMKAARDRLREIEEARLGFGAYTPEGQSVTAEAGRATKERRA